MAINPLKPNYGTRPNSNPGVIRNVQDSVAQGLMQGTGVNDPLDQMLQLELAAVDAKYGDLGGGGGSGGGYSAGPAIASLRSFAGAGDQKLADLYASLGDYIQRGSDATAQQYADSTGKVTGYYDAGAKDIQNASQAAGQAIQQTAALSPAGAGAAGDAQNAARAAIQRQAAIESTNKANQLATLQQQSSGHAAIAKEILAGAQSEGAAQRARLQDQVAGQIAQINQKVAAANASARASGSSNAGKAQAEKLSLAAKYLSLKNTEDQKQSNAPLKGIQGVIAYAKQVGRPDLADKFMSMVSGSRVAATQKNQQSMADPAQHRNITSAEDELQNLIGASGQPSDLNQPALMDLINKNPDFSFLKKYVHPGGFREDPVQQNDFMSKYGPTLPGGPIQKTQKVTLHPYVDPFSDEDYKRFQKVLSKMNDEQNLLGTFYDIYKGTYSG